MTIIPVKKFCETVVTIFAQRHTHVFLMGGESFLCLGAKSKG